MQAITMSVFEQVALTLFHIVIPGVYTFKYAGNKYHQQRLTN